MHFFFKIALLAQTLTTSVFECNHRFDIEKVNNRVLTSSWDSKMSQKARTAFN